MAEYQEVIKQYKRMCDTYKDTCIGCPLEKPRGIHTCWRWSFVEPVKAEAITMLWAEEHPSVTNLDKFKEVFGYDPRLLAIWNSNSHIWFDDEFKEPEDGRSNEN